MIGTNKTSTQKYSWTFRQRKVPCLVLRYSSLSCKPDINIQKSVLNCQSESPLLRNVLRFKVNWNKKATDG